jgi:AcrR family transcriptional regulator
MGRPTRHNPDDASRMIIDAAEALARQDGLRGVSLRKIAAEIGYAPGSLYNVMGDLDEIILHLNARTLQRLEAFLRTRIDPARRPIDNAFAIADGYLDFVVGEPRLWGLILEHRPPPDRDLPPWYSDVLASTTGLVEETLRPLIRDDTERQLSVASLWAALHGIASLATSGKLASVHAAEPHAMAHQILSRFLGAPAPATARQTRHRSLS